MLMTSKNHRRRVRIEADALYSVPEAAEILGLSDVRVRQFCQEERFGLKVGRHYVIRGKDLEEFASIERPRGNPSQNRQKS